MDEEEWSKEQEANRKPGQKHPTPSPGFSDRVFYESLLQQNPTSKMAKKWCLEHGILDWAEAEKMCKALGIALNAETKKKIKKEKSLSTSKSNIVDNVVDPGLSVGNGMELIGTTGL